MKSRRSFLKSGSLGLAGGLGAAQLPGQATAAGAMAAPRMDGGYWNDWPAYLSQEIKEAREKRHAVLRKIRSRAQAEERIAFVREQVWKLIGGAPERTPLNVQSAGTLQKSGYRVEKLIFESQPKLFVPANLYLPVNISGPRPAILAPLGHALNGKAFRSYQTLFQNLARKGYVVLTFDPYGQGERLQYLDRQGRRRFSSTGEHDQFGAQALLIGSTCTQYELWDCMRALDYLLSRPEVDRDRIGCTGHSGGGTMTMYLTALEPRIHVAVEVEGHTENVARLGFDPPGAYADAEQNLIGGLPLGIDRGDLLWAFAPKPLLLCYSHQDSGTTYSATYGTGTQEIFLDLKIAYGLWDSARQVALYGSRLPHDFDYGIRRATYDWFNQWLNRGAGDNSETAFETTPDAELNCTSTGQILTSLGGRTPVDINTERLRALEKNYARNASSPAAVRSALAGILHLPERTAAAHARTLSTNEVGGVTAEEFEFQSEPLIRTPGWLLQAAGTGGKKPVVVYLSDAGKDVLLDGENELLELTKRGVAVCSIDLRGSGVTTPKLPSAGPLFYGSSFDAAYGWNCLVLGKPMLGQRVLDLLACLNYLRTRPDVDAERIGIYGSGSAGLVALLAAALDSGVASLLLERTLLDLGSVVESADYTLPLPYFAFGFLRSFDLPQIAASLAPRPLWLLNPAGANGEALATEAARQRSVAMLTAYSARAAGFRIVVSPAGPLGAATEWLETLRGPRVS